MNANTDEPSDRGIDGPEGMRLVDDDIATRAQQLHATVTHTNSQYRTRIMPRRGDTLRTRYTQGDSVVPARH